MGKDKQPGRGGQKLWTLTYEKIAEWTGLSVATVRNYSQQGAFQKDDIESVLKFVNARREKKGEELIGMPNVAKGVSI